MFVTNVLKLLAAYKTVPTILIRDNINTNARQIFRISTTRNNARSMSTKTQDKEFEVNPDPKLRVVRQMYSSPTKLCLIPESYITFFHTKTGVSGFYVFIVTFGMYLFSKEIMVMEHEFYNGLSMFILCTSAVKYAGPGLAKVLDKEIDLYEEEWNTGRKNMVVMYNKQIENEKYIQWSNEGQLTLREAKREAILMQMEHEYRNRLMTVYRQMKYRLDYQVTLITVGNKYLQKNMVDWVVAQVIKAWTSEVDAKHFDVNLEHLKKLGQVKNAKK